MPAELKIWNGRGALCHNPSDPRWQDVRPSHVHAYLCAASRADARRLVNAYTGHHTMTDSELKTYFAEGAWGDLMEGVPHERGLWLRFSRNTPPVRVWGGDAPAPAAQPASADKPPASKRPATAGTQPAAEPVAQSKPQPAAKRARQQTAGRFPKGDVRRLMVLLAAIEALPRATITTLAEATAHNKGTIAADIDKLREQFGVAIAFDTPVYRLDDWGPLLRPKGVRGFRPTPPVATAA
ncbi:MULTISPECIES: hypothetical protein [Cupriavidus]